MLDFKDFKEKILKSKKYQDSQNRTFNIIYSDEDYIFSSFISGNVSRSSKFSLDELYKLYKTCLISL